MYTFYKAAKFVLKPAFLIVFRPVIIGRENIPKNGAAVIAGNHKHAFDPLMIDISTKRVVRTLAKKALHDGPFGGFFRSAGTIPVDLHARKNPAALEAALAALRKGELVNVSPEAKRNYTNELVLPFKFGAAVMAERTGALIVPYAITGEYKIFTRHRPKIVFGKPFRALGDAGQTNRLLYEKVAELLKQSMPAEELAKKHYTRYEEVKNEKTS